MEDKFVTLQTDANNYTPLQYKDFSNLKLEDYKAISEIPKLNSSISMNQLRWITANKERYGISHAIKKIGRKLYIHVPSLIFWIDSQNA